MPAETMVMPKGVLWGKRRSVSTGESGRGAVCSPHAYCSSTFRTASISPSECTLCSAARVAGSKSEVNTTPSMRAIARWTAVSRSAASW